MKSIAILFLAATAGAQPLAFEVASLKLHKGEVNFAADPSIHGRRVTATAITLTDFITYAYGVRYDQVSRAPKWAASEFSESDRFDLDAKADGEGVLTTAQCREMVQSLLADRFQLKIRRETQETPVYALQVGKGGLKIKPAAPEAVGGSIVNASEDGLHMKVTKGTMAQLARQLSNTAGRPVIDQTGLSDWYVYTLDWFPANLIAPAGSDRPSMFEALQEQLGLKLESTRGPVEKLVIEHAEKPSEN